MQLLIYFLAGLLLLTAASQMQGSCLYVPLMLYAGHPVWHTSGGRREP